MESESPSLRQTAVDRKGGYLMILFVINTLAWSSLFIISGINGQLSKEVFAIFVSSLSVHIAFHIYTGSIMLENPDKIDKVHWIIVNYINIFLWGILMFSMLIHEKPIAFSGIIVFMLADIWLILINLHSED